jgi:hypothetical protein
MKKLGGDPFFFNTIDELYSFYNLRQPLRTMQTNPSFLNALAHFKSHRSDRACRTLSTLKKGHPLKDGPLIF